MKKLFPLFIFINISFGLCAQSVNSDYLFKQGDNGYSCFRIPAILVTAKGNVLAFAEGRKRDCSDSGDIDMVMRRSADGCQTWSAMQMIWSDSLNTCGNPVPVQDTSTGRIFLVCCWNAGDKHEEEIRNAKASTGRRVFVMHSDDEGITWSKAKEITGEVKSDEWSWYATGPCHGLQISKGRYKGRLVIPVNHVVKATGANFAHIIYSDDHGLSWKIGNNAPYERANETTVAELSNGDLMLNSRSADRQVRYRRVAISSDGGANWKDRGADTVLIEPICQGSLLRVQLSKNKSALLFSNPANRTRRATLTLRTSFDDGKSWPLAHILFAGTAAYSDIAVWRKNMLCLYEAGSKKSNEGIVFKAVLLKEILTP